jgi:DNA-binding CsgD family transcriptional regulator
MPVAVRQERSIFSTVALVLLFITQALGVYTTMVLRFSQPQAALFAVVFYTVILLCGAILSLLPLPRNPTGGPCPPRAPQGRDGQSPSASTGARGVFSPVPVLLALCAALLLAGHGMGREGGIFAMVARVIGVAGLWMTALHAFFLFAPQRRKGLLLGTAAASGELIWVVLLPAMNIFFSDAAGPVLSGHFLKIQMALQCGSLLLLAAAFVFKPARAGNALSDTPYAGIRSEDSAKPSVLPLLFFAALSMYVLYGLGSGLVFPRMEHSGVPDSAHILLLLTMPLTGTLVDRGGRGCRLLLTALAVLAFAAPAILLTRPEGMAREALYALLCVGRQGAFLATLLLADRLIRKRSRLPLLLALAYILPVTATAGRAIARADAGFALEAGIAFGLALAFALLVMRLFSDLSGLPPAGEEADLPAAFASGRLAAFVTRYGLSRQEIQVMEMLAQAHSTENIATAMHVQKKTVNTYVSRILQKSGVPNRAVLIEVFASQTPTATESKTPVA